MFVKEEKEKHIKASLYLEGLTIIFFDYLGSNLDITVLL